MDKNGEHTGNSQDLSAKIGQIGGDLSGLLEEHVQLFKREMKEEISQYLRDGLALSFGGLLATIGFVLLSSRLPKIAGAAYMIIGGTTVLVAGKRMAGRKLVPKGISEEVRKDRQWFEHIS